MKGLSIIESIQSFNSEDFHFLRPNWLWLLLILALLVLLMVFSNREKSKWRSLISEPLRGYMFSKASKSAVVWPVVVFVLTMSFGIIALAGPSWKRIELPGMKSTAVMMILMDLSWSMMAEDIQPNRLERAKLKVRDLMDANPGARTSLFVYAGTTHPVLPLTSDYKLIRHHTDNLQTNIMPVRGDDLNLSFDIVDTLFNRFEAPSTLLLITDEVEADETQRLFNFVDSSPHSIEILVMSTSKGAPVPGFRRGTSLRDAAGERVISAGNENIWSQLDRHEKITINRLTLDKSDVEAIAGRVRKELVFQADKEESQETWQDEGLLFLIPTLIFGLFFFRKGWMIQWCLVGGFFFFTSCAPDDKNADWWYSADYKGQLFEEEGRYLEAAESYTDAEHKAAAYFKAGNYEAAAELYASDTSAAGLYNYGLAMANMGEYEAAINALEMAMEKDPDLQNGDKVIDLISSAIAVQDSIARFDPKKATEEGKKGQLNEREAQSEDDELSSDTEAEELPEEGDRITDEVLSDISQAEEMEKPDENMDAGEKKDASKIMLRRISAEPTEFLRRRFKYQKEKYYPNVKEGKKKW